MAENTLSAGFGGGITRFKEEYNSKFKISPSAVVVMIIVVIAFVLFLNIFFPIA